MHHNIKWQEVYFYLIVRGVHTENPAHPDGASSVILPFERTHEVPSRELRTVSFCIDVIVLAPARTVKGLSLRGSSRSRSNGKEGNGRCPYRSRCNHRELLNVDIETDPGSSRSRSNSKGIIVAR